MAEYRPSLPFATALIVLKPTYEKVAGVSKKVLPDLKDGIRINASFKSYGGTETTVDGVYSVIDTVDVETWYRPDITSDCIIALAATGAKYRLLNTPENISNRNQFLKFRMERIKGGA